MHTPPLFPHTHLLTYFLTYLLTLPSTLFWSSKSHLYKRPTKQAPPGFLPLSFSFPAQPRRRKGGREAIPGARGATCGRRVRWRRVPPAHGLSRPSVSCACACARATCRVCVVPEQGVTHTACAANLCACVPPTPAPTLLVLPHEGGNIGVCGTAVAHRLPVLLLPPTTMPT